MVIKNVQSQQHVQTVIYNNYYIHASWYKPEPYSTAGFLNFFVSKKYEKKRFILINSINYFFFKPFLFNVFNLVLNVNILKNKFNLFLIFIKPIQ